MKTRKIQIASIICLLLAILLESKPWLVTVTQEWGSISYGLGLALVLVAAGLNVKIIKTMGIQDSVKKTSQLILLVISLFAVYTFVLS